MRNSSFLLLLSSSIGLSILLGGCSTLLGFEDLSPADDSGLADSGSSDSSSSDSQPDSSVDAAVDVPPDYSADASPDSAVDSAADASPDSTVDSAADTSLDTFVDSSSDSPVDASLDSSADSMCGDTNLDTHNCGACGHDCLGATCLNGACQPVALASNLKGPRDLIVDNSFAYVVVENNNTVIRVALDKSGIDLLSGDYAWVPWSIRLVGDSIYWTNSVSAGYISSCPKTGCPVGSSVNILSSLRQATGLAISSDKILWIESYDHSIKMASFPSAQNVVTLLAPDSSANIVDLTVFGKFVYFVDASSGAVQRIALAGGNPESVGGDGMPCNRIASVNSGILWSCSSSSSGRVWSLPIKSDDSYGPPSVFADNQNNPKGMAADSQNVYWSNAGSYNGNIQNGSIMWCPVSGCGNQGPRVLASALSYPMGIAVANNAVVWGEYGVYGSTGAVKMVAKPH
jgi:hypothetical protein